MQQIETMAVLKDNLREVIVKYNVKIQLGKTEYEITIPQFFAYDGASIPKCLWSICGSPYDSCHDTSSCVHDYLYRKQSDNQVVTNGKNDTVSRKIADDIFYDLLLKNENGKMKALMIYLTVRMFGGMFYKRH
jgi:hypothetical protein